MMLTETQIKIIFEGKAINLEKPVCRDVNRLYLPLDEFIKKINGKIISAGQSFAIFKPKLTIHLGMLSSEYSTTTYQKVLYISLFDLCRLVNLKTVWSYENQSISLYLRKEKTSVRKPGNSKRPALIRFEDIRAGDQYLDSGNLERFRVVGDYLYSLGVPFHITWIPRFVDPPGGIDNDISMDYSIENAHFLFTVEYLLHKGGTIGLHGYTHQYGDEVSGDGTEFDEERNHDEVSVRGRIEAAIACANKLFLPCKFFESPHYASTAYQQSIYEEYFDIIYEGFVGIWGEKVVKSPRNHRTIYVPTPLGYVESDDGLAKMLERIENIDDESLASLFYHPSGEFDFITVSSDEAGYPTYDYKKDSPLHQMVDALFEKNCRFIKVTDLLNEK